ncbi:carbohydrate kinase family protein [Nocardia sp. R16R-3T]
MREEDQPTSSSVLPIRLSGERRSRHLLSANPFDALDDIDWAALAAVDHLHLGGPELIGATNAARVLQHAKDNGVSTSVATRRPRRRPSAHSAFAIEVVDTTDCGDAFAAGFIRAIALGRNLRAAAILGSAVAALVARGLGSDHGISISPSRTRSRPRQALSTRASRVDRGTEPLRLSWRSRRGSSATRRAPRPAHSDGP